MRGYGTDEPGYLCPDDEFTDSDEADEKWARGPAALDPIFQPRWCGTWPAKCDRCNTPLDKQKVFYDAVDVTKGVWRLFCHYCWCICSPMKLGVGLGQKYDSKSRIKIGG